MNTKHNDDELREAPLLSKLRSAEFFQVPGDYFDSLKLELEDKIEDETHLAEGTVLKSLDRQNIFLTPEGYFERFKAQILALTGNARMVSLTAHDQNKKAQSRTIYWLSAAAAVALLCAVVWILPSTRKSDALEVELALLPTEDLIDALDKENVDLHHIVEVADIEASYKGFTESLSDEQIEGLLDGMQIPTHELEGILLEEL